MLCLLLILCLLATAKAEDYETALAHMHALDIAQARQVLERLPEPDKFSWQRIRPWTMAQPTRVDEQAGEYSLHRKLRDIIMPRIRFDNAPLPKVLDFLRARSRELDIDGTGVNIVYLRPLLHDQLLPRVTIDLSDFPLGEAIRYVSQTAGHGFAIHSHAVVVCASGVPHQALTTAYYWLPEIPETALPELLQMIGLRSYRGSAVLRLGNLMIVRNTLEGHNTARVLLWDEGDWFAAYRQRVTVALVTIDRPPEHTEPLSTLPPEAIRVLERLDVVMRRDTAATVTHGDSSLTVTSTIEPDGYTLTLAIDAVLALQDEAAYTYAGKLQVWDGEAIATPVGPGEEQRYLLVTAFRITPNGFRVRP